MKTTQMKKVLQQIKMGMVLLGLTLTLTSTACGSGDYENSGTGIPATSVCLPHGFGSLSFTLVCPINAGGADKICTFFVYTDNNVVATSSNTFTVAENSSQTFTVTTIGNQTGTSRLLAQSDSDPQFKIADLHVGC